VPAPVMVGGEQARESIVGSLYNGAESDVDEDNPVVKQHGRKKGKLVRVWPTDSGSRHNDIGKLVSMNSKEVVIETGTVGVIIRIHAPRNGFRVCAVNKAEL
jgi:hypothetical protein